VGRRTALATTLDTSVWESILKQVHASYPAFVRRWFGDLRPGSFDGCTLQIRAADEGQCAYLERHCRRAFIDAAQTATGMLVTVAFASDGEPVRRRRAFQGNGSGVLDHDAAMMRLNPECTFENFVVGPCNRLAQASCVAVSASPGTAYNPLFIHGDSGLGKTHLLQAICHAVWDGAPGTRIVYLTCETFVNHFIEAVERGLLERFRHRYRDIDVLMIDDVQFLAGRDRTQEEFFHTFNALYQGQKQIVLTADFPPSDIPKLEERLVSRFNWGLVSRIDRPCLETRLAILRKKVRLRGLHLDDDVAMLIASRLESNTRELEGALTQLEHMAKLDNVPIDLMLARQALGDTAETVSRPLRVPEIMQVIIDHFGVTMKDLTGRRRSRSIVMPRQVGMYLAREHTPLSLEEIGAHFGGRDHTTVLHAQKLVRKRREQDVQFRARLEEVERQLRRLVSPA